MTTEEMLALEKAALDRIKATRLEKGMSEKTLGEAAFKDAGHAQTKVSRLYNPMTKTGKTTRPTLGEWLAMCQALSLTPQEELNAFLRETTH